MAKNPADLPNYKHPDYVKMEPILKLLHDVYDNLYGRKAEYLPKATMEPANAYSARVERTTFNNKVRPAIESNAGLLTAFEVSNESASLAEHIDDVDGRGSSLKSFLKEADIKALRDRHCFILTDSPQGDLERTAADSRENPIRPYWQLIDRRDVLNWRSHYDNGKYVLDHVTVRMNHVAEDGSFGIKAEPHYHVFRRLDGGVSHEVFRMEGDEVQRVGGPQIAAIARIPLLCYPFLSSPFSTDIPPYLKAAELNLKLFRKQSSLDELEYAVNAPTPWRKSNEPMSERQPIVFGSSWVIELFEGDDVGILEITGDSIDSLQKSIDELKKEIEAETTAFLSGNVQRTATEAYITSTALQSSLNGYARQKMGAIGAIADDWGMFSGEENSIQVAQDESVLEMPLDAQEMGALLNFYNSDVVSHETLLELLKMGRQLPPNFDVQREVQRLAAERRQQAAAPQPTLNELLNQEEL